MNVGIPLSSQTTSFSVGDVGVLTASHAHNSASYIGDRGHPRHAGLHIFGTYFIGANCPETFERKTKALYHTRDQLKKQHLPSSKLQFEPETNRELRPKRRPKTHLAWHLMAGLRPWLALTEKQIVTLQNAVLELIPPTGILAWGVHAETRTGFDKIPRYYDIDFHFSIAASQDIWLPEENDFRLDRHKVRLALDKALNKMLGDSNSLGPNVSLPTQESPAEINKLVQSRLQRRREYEQKQIQSLNLSESEMKLLLHYPRLNSALHSNANSDDLDRGAGSNKKAYQRSPQYLSWGDLCSYDLQKIAVLPAEKVLTISSPPPRQQLPCFAPPPKPSPPAGQEPDFWLAAFYPPEEWINRKKKRLAAKNASASSVENLPLDPPHDLPPDLSKGSHPSINENDGEIT